MSKNFNDEWTLMNTNQRVFSFKCSDFSEWGEDEGWIRDAGFKMQSERLIGTDEGREPGSVLKGVAKR